MATRVERDFVHNQGGDMHPVAYFAAIGVSILIHVALLTLAGESKINFVRGVDATVEQRMVLRQESAMQVKVFEEDPELPFQATFEPAKDPYTVETEDFLDSLPTDTPGASMEPPAVSADLGLGIEAEIKAPPVADRLESPIPWQPREDLVMMVDKVVYDDQVPFERRDVPDIERQAFAPDVTLAYELSEALESANRVGTPAYVSPAPPEVDDAGIAETLVGGEVKMPDVVEAGPVASGEEAAEFFREIPAEVAPAKPIENVLKAIPVVYRPRRSDGYTYFRVDVGRKTEAVLPPLPRDILIVQDASASLAPQRLYYCKQAFRDVIDGLQPTDRFNVLKFDTVFTYCFGETWQPADAANRTRAKVFIDAIEASGNTDIFSAVKSVLALPRSDARTMIVLFASDGRTTAGQLRRDTEIIGEFSALNAGEVSIFNFGVSPNSNEFLMSMLSFCNRGGPAAIAMDRFKIPTIIDEVVSTLGRPVLKDIRFMFDSASGADVSPEMTTHLYLDRPMQLYGRVPEDQEAVVFQARGMSGGTRYDMMFTLDLENAEKGEAGLSTDWARAKMYDLVARHAREPSSTLLFEMNELGKRYKITVPFKDRLF